MRTDVLQGSAVLVGPASPGRRRTLAVVMVLVSLLVLEAGVRAVLAVRVGPSVLYYGTRFQRQTVPAATNTHTVMQHGNMQPGYTKFFPHEVKIDHDPTTHEPFRVAINSRGFRGGEIADRKPPGVTRIVTLGSSSTFGYYDRDHETYPVYLEQTLNQAAAGPGRFEVINLGIPHLRSEEILALFYAEALPLHPDVVTFYEGVNDAARGNPRGTAGDRTQAPPRPTAAALAPVKAGYGFLRDRVVMVAFLDSLRQTLLAEPTFTREQVARHMTGTSEHFIGTIDTLYQECRRRGILLVVLKQQAKSHLVTDTEIKGVTYAQEVQLVQEKLDNAGAIKARELHLLTHRVLTTDLEQWAVATHVPFVNVQTVLDQDRDVLVSWVHLSPRGNRMLAEALAQEILRVVGRSTANGSDRRAHAAPPS